MTTRHTGLKAALATVLLFTVAGAALFACGGDDAAAPEVTSAPRPTTTTPDPSDPDLPDLTIPDLTIPGEVGDTVGKISDCSDVVLAYTQLAITVLQGDQAQAAVDEVLDKVRPKVPADLQDDLKVVGDAYAKAAKVGIVKAPQVLDEPDFRKANKAIGDWLSKECGVDLSGN
jgi:hypothetical protein